MAVLGFLVVVPMMVTVPRSVAVVVIVAIVVTVRALMLASAAVPHAAMILVLVIILVALVPVPGERGAEVVRRARDEQAGAGRPVLARVVRLAIVRLGRACDECCKQGGECHTDEGTVLEHTHLVYQDLDTASLV